MSSLSFCDFSDSTEGTIPPSSLILGGLNPPQISTFRSPIQGPSAPRLDVDWSDSPPLSLSLRFSGIFSDTDLEGDITRRTHQSRSVSLDMSYDVQTFPNLKDVVPDFANDSDISEVVLMTPKLPATLSTIPEVIEPSPVLTYTTSLSDFDILNIGNTSESGTSVMTCKRRKTGKLYKIRCRRDHLPWTEQDILETLRDLGAPFLPHLRSSFREDGRVHLVLDHLPSGSLRDLVERTGSLTSQRVMFYASEIVVGISNLHSIGIMHRNLNPDDIMFDASGHVVISNFEFSDFVATTGMNASIFPGGFLKYPRAQCYQSPEVLLGWAHDCVVDCWGFGMLLYFMLFGKHPFKSGIGPEGSEDLQARIIEGTLSPDSLRLIHPQTRDLILKCIERNPRVRLTLEEIKRHAFFANVTWTKVADRLVEVPPLPASFDPRPSHVEGHTPYSSVPPPPPKSPKGLVDTPQRSTMEVRPLRIEKKASRSSVLPPSRNIGDPSADAGLQSPRINGKYHFRSVRPTEATHLEPRENVDDQRGGGGTGVEIWDILDQEEEQEQEQRDQAALASSRSGATRGNFLSSLFKSRKAPLRGSSHHHHQRTGSVYGPKSLFMNLSTASFSRAKKAGKLGSTPVPVPGSSAGCAGSDLGHGDNDEDRGRRGGPGPLPLGVQQIGSGIGFSCAVGPTPSATRRPSIASIGSGTTPRSCAHNIFRSGVGAVASSTASAKQQLHAPKALGMGLDGLMPDGAYIFDGEPIVTSSSGERTGKGTTIWMPNFMPTTQPPYLIQGSTTTTSSSSPETDDGPFTPTAVDCDHASRSQSFKDFDPSSLDGKMEPDLTLRLVRSTPYA